MAVTMDLEATVSDSKLERDKKESRQQLSTSKSEVAVGEATSAEQLQQFKSWVSNERWTELKNLADKAMKDHRVFMIRGGGYPAVRRALTHRGWLEKYEPHKARNPPPNIDPKKASGKELSRVERMILFKFLEHYSVDFLWTTKRDKYDWLLSNKEVIISRFCRSFFTSKEGLTSSLVQMHWYTEPGISLMRFPRCYNVNNSEMLEEFVEDFRLTACTSLLKWLTNTLAAKNNCDELVSATGKVPLSAMEFAFSRLNECIAFHTHLDIDEPPEEPEHVWEHEWDQFLTHHYLLVHDRAKFYEDNNTNIRNVEKKAAKILAAVIKYCPQFDIDGVLNIWIVKPGNKCRGKGILLMNNIKEILSLINIQQKTRYVVQKYIENPLVVYDTKFDIRQWFLVTNCQPLTIWVYRDSYLRFSSQIFSLSNYHESVHLTNNAVQSRYKNNHHRSKSLPDDNMWDSHSFKAYLKQIGKSDMWEKKIYPGIKQCLIGAMLACQDGMDKRQTSFELYGADFMLSEDFTPWLIEINSSPDLAPTTSVTAKMCPRCLEDVIKVVIDRRLNAEADTGTFELAYRQMIPKSSAYLGLSLCVNGKKIFKKKIEKKPDARGVAPIPPAVKVPSSILLKKESKEQLLPSEYSGPIITEFLTWLNPYDTLPTNKNGIVIGPKNDLKMVRQSLTIAKSGLAIKCSSIKRKKSTLSSRIHRTRREKNTESYKHLIVPHLCYRTEQSRSAISTNKNSSELANKTEKCKVDVSVGNKRCYIDPIEREQESSCILRSNVSTVHNKMFNNSVPAVCSTKSSLFNSSKVFDPCISRNVVIDKDSSKLSAIGRNISKLQEESRTKKAIVNSKSCSSMYAPYRVVPSSLNEPQNLLFKRKST